MTTSALPGQLKAAVALLIVESVALVGLAGYFVYGILTDQSIILSTMMALTGFTLATAVWVLFLARGLMNLKKSARTPAMFWQLCQLAIAYGSVTGPNPIYAVGAAIAAPSIAVIALLLSKPVSALLQREMD